MNSLLEYYRKNTFNPVPISVEEHEIWNAHAAKRRNLYERHLGIPLPLLRDRAVIEFGTVNYLLLHFRVMCYS